MKIVSRLALAALLWLLSCALWPPITLAEDVPLGPRRGVLLLDNGELIAGLITAAGDRYDVNLEDGEIHIQRSQVELVARDANECYLHKRARIEQDRVQDHLDLAQWCLRHALLDAAEKEIAAAKASDATHPKIRLVETRLALAKESPRPAVTTQAVPHGKKVSPEDQMDASMRNLPAGAVESYTNNIQPMLLNYCTRSGCHGAQAGDALRLERISPNRRAGRKPTQRNLQSVLALVNREKPDESRLLLAPVSPHGGLKSPIFGDRDLSQYQLLRQWVYYVSSAKGQSPPPTLEERTAPLLQTMPRSGTPAESGERPSADDQNDSKIDGAANPVQTPATTPDPSQAAAPAAGATEQFRISHLHGQPVLRPMAKRAETVAGFVPKDPFDPAIFNRRNFGE